MSLVQPELEYYIQMWTTYLSKRHRSSRKGAKMSCWIIGFVSEQEDHHRVLVAAMSNPPTGWRRPRGCPRETWLRTVSKDVQPFNIGIHSAWHRAADRQQWRDLIDTAMLQ